MNEPYRQLQHRFTIGMRANLITSLSFEILQIAHQYALLSLLAPAGYGLIGMVFSSMYLMIALSELSGISSMGPFLSLFTQSKRAFRYYYLRYFCTQIPLLCLGAAGILLLATHTSSFACLLSPSCPPVWIIMLGVMVEGLRMMQRMFLHGVFWHRSTSIIELSSMIVYVTLIWAPYITYRTIPSVTTVCTVHILCAGIVLIILSMQVIRFYHSLNDDKSLDPHEQQLFWRRCIKTRSANYAMYASDKALFTSNLLMPLFVNQNGISQAGLLKFAGYVADAVRGIIRAAIGFSGTALFATLKHSPLAYKQHAFRTVSNNLHKILCFSMVFIGLALYAGFGNMPSTYAPAALITPVALFLTITLLGHLSTVYHTFYVIEEKAYIIVGLRLIELVLLYVVLAFGTHGNALFSLIYVALTRLLSLSILAADGYYRWGIQPLAGVRPRFIIGSAVITLFVLLCVSTII